MTTRRLAAILAADVVGFSSMMERDEEGTLRLLKATQRDLIEPRVREHHGRIVKTTGDGFLIEFGSPLDAVRCALEVQEAVSANGEPGGSQDALRLRMGINLGDIIIEEDGDIYGDGVNVAARLEQLAGPGTICISGKVFDEVEGKLTTNFAFTGEQQVKNLSRPVRVYSSISAPQAKGGAKPLSLPDKPSIAVLPFTNMSGDPEQDYFADGMVEEIITALSKNRWLMVIARNSTFTYKGRAVDVKQAGRELGVRYVLEGSVRKAARRLRITGQLIDATTGAHLWADHFDGELEQVFELQDQVTSSVVGAIAPKLEQAEMERAARKPTESLDAYDLVLRGTAHVNRATREDYETALDLFYRAVSLDPAYATAFAWASWCYSIRKGMNWTVEAEREVAEGCRLARLAVELGENDAIALCLGGWTLGNLGRDLRAAEPLTEQALALNPNLAIAWLTSAWIKLWLGDAQEALTRLSRAQRLNPLDPSAFLLDAALAHAYYHSGRLDEAAAAAERGLAGAAALVRLGRLPEARAVVKRVLAVGPDSRASDLQKFPYRNEEAKRRTVEALMEAGLPE